MVWHFVDVYGAGQSTSSYESGGVGKEVGIMQVQIEVKEKKKERKRMEQYLERWKKKGGQKYAGC